MKTANIKVDYIDHMGDDLTVVNAARVSFHKEHDAFTPEDDKLILYLARHNHWSPFAHASVSFRVKAPIFVARQLVKHTVGFSWNEVSRRYVDEEPEFYFPKHWRAKAENVKQGSSDLPIEHSGIWTDAAKQYVFYLNETYKNMINDGICAEQARMILPQNTMTEWIWTGTLYAWARMCGLRLDPHTQRETREVAEQIDEIMAQIFPVSWDALMKD